MRSRVTTYVLIVAALGVWGFVAWKIFFQHPDPPSTAVHHPTPRETPEVEKRALNLDYKDPFLKDAVPVKTTGTSGRVRRNSPVEQPSRQQPFPPSDPGIKYAGTISTGGRTSHLFEHAGLLHPLSVGEILDGYTFTEALGDSVRLAKDGAVFTIHLQQ